MVPSYPFMTGFGFKSFCGFTLDEQGFVINPQIKNNYYFVKTDLLPDFVNRILKDILEPFILMTHNSDFVIGENWKPLLDHPKLISWFGVNVYFNHPKLKSIPIGIANGQWKHGDITIFKHVMDRNLPKTNLVYANYDVNTNTHERLRCRDLTGIPLAPIKGFESYLSEMSSSYFVISPNGNGVDCHRHWEALYLKTIPIVTNSINMSFYKNLPILVIENWESFKNLKLNKELYNQIWNNFDPTSLFIDKFMERIRHINNNGLTILEKL